MVGNGNTRKAETMRVSQHRKPDYKNMLGLPTVNGERHEMVV